MRKLDTQQFLESVDMRENKDFEGMAKRLQDPTTLKLLHGSIGMCTEAGEFQDALKKHIIYGKEIDKVNLIEEIGDQLWYVGVVLNALGSSFEEAMSINNEKLAARYGDVFSEDAALNRNLDKEREILEGDDA